MEKKNHTNSDSKYMVWVAIIGGVFAVIVAMVNKKAESQTKSSTPENVNVTVTAGESQNKKAPESTSPPLPAKVDPPLPLLQPCFDAKKVLYELDRLIVKSNNVLKDRQDIAQYEAWRSECSGVLTRLKLCKYNAFAARFEEITPFIAESDWHLVGGAVQNGKQVLEILRNDIAMAYLPHRSHKKL